MFFKITNRAENHHGMQYLTGLNTDILPFNPSGECESGGIYFSDSDNIFRFLAYGDYIREVVLPKGEQVYKEEYKYKAHRVILKRKRRLDTVNTWKWMASSNINMHSKYAIEWAAENGHLNIVKYLVSQGANIHANDDEALRLAAKNGQLATIKYLVSIGANIHAGEDYALRFASANGYFTVVKYLISKGADVHARDDKAIKWAYQYCHLEIFQYLNSLK